LAESYTMVPYHTGNADKDAERLNETVQSRKLGKDVITSRNMFTIEQLNEQLKGRLVDGEHDEDDKVECIIDRMRIHLQIAFYPTTQVQSPIAGPVVSYSIFQGQPQIIDLIMLYALEFSIYSGSMIDDNEGLMKMPRDNDDMSLVYDVILCRALHPTDPMSDRTEITLSIPNQEEGNEIPIYHSNDFKHARVAIMVEIPPVGYTGLWADVDHSSISYFDDANHTCIRAIDFKNEEEELVEVFDDIEDEWKPTRPSDVPKANERATGYLKLTYGDSLAEINSGSLTFYAREI